MSLTEEEPLQAFLRLADAPEAAFPAHVHLALATARYAVRTATSYAEVRQALQLRHEVFIQEGLQLCLPAGLEIDAHDLDSDHLLVFDQASGRAVGNYRLRCSLYHRRFYSESEFVLDDSLQQDDAVKVEIGRACVHPAHRNGVVLQLLWRGLGAYVRQTAARILFGCTSVPAGMPGLVETIWDELCARNRVSLPSRARPRVPFRCGPERVPGAALPPLLAGYLRFGAHVLGPPAFDAFFHCGDFLMQLDVHDVPARRLQRYEAS
jgi:putative hemolysin